MTRDELIRRTRQLIAEGERLDGDPSLTSLQTWLQLSDDLLGAAWGTMDRYHLAWLMVGKPKSTVRGRPLTADEESAYVREVASAKTEVLRASLDAVDRQHMPFRGETGGIGAGQGMGMVPGARAGAAGSAEAVDTPAAADAGAAEAANADAEPAGAGAVDTAGAAAGDPNASRPDPSRNRQIPLDPELASRLDDVRHAAAEHARHAAATSPAQRRAPRPERLQH